MRTPLSALALLLCLILGAGCAKSPNDKPRGAASNDAANKDAAAKDAAAKDAAMIAALKELATQAANAPTKSDAVSLFDGKTMGKWKSTNFGGEGEVTIKDGAMTIASGNPLSGVTWQGDPPFKMNYEISLEAQRAEGGDFFLGLTVPVKDDYISLILGGWGGTTVGLSSLDGNDAANNEYVQYISFDQGKWYKVRMVVKEKQILVFLDGKQIIDANTDGRRISTRIEVEPSQPLGISTFSTTGAFRNIQVKPVK